MTEYYEPLPPKPPGPAYPLVPTRSQLAALELTPAERAYVSRKVVQDLKGVGWSIDIEAYAGASPEEVAHFMIGLYEKGLVVWEPEQPPRLSYLAQVLVNAHRLIVYAQHAAYRTRQHIMWERALDAADAAGHPVEWTGDRPDGIDETIPLPREIVERLKELGWNEERLKELGWNEEDPTTDEPRRARGRRPSRRFTTHSMTPPWSGYLGRHDPPIRSAPGRLARCPRPRSCPRG